MSERESVSVRESMSECVSERERVCVCVCVCLASACVGDDEVSPVEHAAVFADHAAISLWPVGACMCERGCERMRGSA